MKQLLLRAGQSVINAAWRATHGQVSTNKRSFAAAQSGRLFGDWVGHVGLTDETIRRDLMPMKANSRRLALNNDYMKAFLRSVRRNTVGPKGVVFESRALDDDGTLDKVANAKIEAAVKEWGKKGVCTVCGKLSWVDVQRLVMTSTARDGEIIIREIRGFPNKFRYALQIINSDALEINLNKNLTGGAFIRMGVEMDKWERPVAYHLRVTKGHNRSSQIERVPASEIIHMFISEDAGQTRGFPWAHTAIRRLGMLGGYEEASLVAARAGAAKMGFFQVKEGASANYAPAEKDKTTGEFIQSADPGHFEILPEGYEFKEFNPGYPAGEMAPFMKTVLRGAAAGLGLSYNAFANDLEGVNLSALRGGLIEERDEWMVLQGWMIEGLNGRVHGNFLEQALLAGVLGLPFAKFDKFNVAKFFPRRWKWVDPDKESKANERDVSLGVTSRTQIAADQGRDIRDVLEEIAAEEKHAEEIGVVLGEPKQEPEKPEEGEEDEPEKDKD